MQGGYGRMLSPIMPGGQMATVGTDNSVATACIVGKCLSTVGKCFKQGGQMFIGSLYVGSQVLEAYCNCQLGYLQVMQTVGC